MRHRIPVFVLLASALTFLASLYLPWRVTAPLPSGVVGGPGLLTLFAGGSVEGWVSVAGDVAVLLVIATVLATIVALRRPQLAPRLPLGGLGVGVGYFAVAVAVEVHTLSREVHGGFSGAPRLAQTSWAYGFYLGLASAAIAALSGLAVHGSELRRLRGAADGAAAVLGVALLVAFLLPWVGFSGLRVSTSFHGIESPPAALAALTLLLGAGRLHGEAGRRWRLAVAIATAVLAGAAASAVTLFGDHLYGAWIGVGCAVSLVALEAARAWRVRAVRLPVPPRGSAAFRTGAAVLLIVALFLPWEVLHTSGADGNWTDGWYSVTGTAAGGLCLLLLATPALPALEDYVLDLVVAVVIFVSVAGTAFRESSFFYRAGYGAFIGFAAAGILLATALMPLRPGHVDRRRALVRAVPLAASVLCIAAVVVPLWFVLPESWMFQAAALYGTFTVPGVLLALYLVRLWALRVGGLATTGHRLTVVPLILLTLASLELIRFRDSVVIWGAVILVVLSLLLVLCGWIEEDGGAERLRVPEVLRVDRLPETEA